MAAASVAVKTPIRMPPMIRTIISRLGTARQQTSSGCRRGSSSAPGTALPYPLRIETAAAAIMMHAPTRMPGRMPAMNIAAIDTEPADTE